MAIHVLNGLDMNSTKVTNLGAPTSNNDAVRLVDLNAAVEGVNWKDSCRVGTVANIDLSSAPAVIDGIGMSGVGTNRVLVKDQTVSEDNGIYVWNGTGAAMTRALDANTSDELTQAVTLVERGTYAGTSWRQTTNDPTIGSSLIQWTQFGGTAPAASETTPGIIEIATQAEVNAGLSATLAVTPAYLAGWSNSPKRYSVSIGDGSNVTYTVTHNLGTTDVSVQVARVAAPGDIVWTDVERTNTNTVTVKFATAPTTNQYRVTVLA